MIGWFTLAGAVIALILAIINIPCLASLPLTVLEVWMFIKLSGMYGFKLADSEFLWLMVGLVVMSLVLSFIVEAVLTWFPIVGWVLKSAIAAAVVFGLGWAAITYLHRQRLLKMQKRT
jgi:uncharacterized protein (DUF697 family)